MEMTPHRQELIDAHVAETRTLMADYAFELNDLVRFALSAAKDKGHKVYYPMDPVNECIRNWQGLSKKVAKLAADLEQTAQRLGAQPFDPETPASADGEPPTPGT
ncbi:MAG: hypothetical protein H7Y33_20370 [Cytophagales bacterium]|nr:hypothetical protein [Rhizobacter sp.]